MPEAFLDHHVAVFNDCVATGEFAPLVDLFDERARLAFVGVPVGPFVGRDAIAAAYEQQPPDDTMEIRNRWVEADGLVVEEFSWSRDGRARSRKIFRTVHPDAGV